jgi:hypothetical protein
MQKYKKRKRLEDGYPELDRQRPHVLDRKAAVCSVRLDSASYYSRRKRGTDHD